MNNEALTGEGSFLTFSILCVSERVAGTVSLHLFLQVVRGGNQNL